VLQPAATAGTQSSLLT